MCTTIKKLIKSFRYLIFFSNKWFKYGKDIQSNDQNLDFNITDEEINELFLKEKKQTDKETLIKLIEIREKFLN
jgi:uncharacterized membrane protein YobD (UPF0266 family)